MNDFQNNFEYIQKQINQNKIDLVDLCKFYLNRIKNNLNYNIFIEVFEKQALKKAKEIQIKINNNTAGNLAGLFIGLKDNISYKGHKVSASSKILQGYVSPYNSTVVERLLKQDAIIIGRLNCDEFAMGSSNENSFYGPSKNPINPTKVPGGSSGGSAAAVSMDLCTMSLGSDTGGSLRQPASFCGVIGFKPTYGTVSRYGLLSYASSFDQIGPISKNIKDIFKVMNYISGKDSKDSTTSKKNINYEKLKKKKKYKILFSQDFLKYEHLDNEIKKRFLCFLEELKSKGHEIQNIKFKYLDYVLPVYYILTTAEASSNLSRYDGIRYGYRFAESKDIKEVFVKSRSEGFGDEVKRRIMLGTFVLSQEYYEAYYTKAQKTRRMILNEYNKTLKEADFLLTPTTPNVAFGLNEVQDPIKMKFQDIFTVTSNLVGAPSISLPSFKNSNNMPFGLQVMGKNFGDADVLSFSDYLQNNYDFNS